MAESARSVTLMSAVSVERQGPEAVLGWGEEMVGCKEVVQLVLHHFLHHLRRD